MKYMDVTKKFELTFRRDHDRLSLYCGADYAKKEMDGRSVSRVAVIYGSVVASAMSRTQHCVTQSTTEAEYVAARGQPRDS